SDVCSSDLLTRVQVAPASSDTNTPPESASMIAYTRFGSAPETETPTLPITPCGSPGLRVISVHVSPPSTDLNSPEPGPPLESIHSVRYASQKPAYMTCGFDGVSARSTAPARSLRYSTLRQVLPPSVLLNTPRSSFGPNSRPSAATYTRSQLVGWMRMRPIARASVSPMCVQVLPASVDL